jgi:hypothetical protein
MARKVMINQATRRTAQVMVQNILKPTYFKDGVPLDDLADALKDMGIVMVMEDNTEWAGFLVGSQGECFIRLAPMTTAVMGQSWQNKDIVFYDPYENTGLR